MNDDWKETKFEFKSKELRVFIDGKEKVNFWRHPIRWFKAWKRNKKPIYFLLFLALVGCASEPKDIVDEPLEKCETIDGKTCCQVGFGHDSMVVWDCRELK